MINSNFNKHVLLAGLFFLLASGPLFAHKISVLGWVEEDTVFIEGYFSGGTKPRDAELQIFDPDGNILAEGRTDDNGEYSFKVPAVTTLRVHLNAGAGHQAECEIPEEEIRAEAEATSPVSGNGEGAATGSINEAALRKIVSSEVNKQLKHFANQMKSAEAGAEPSLTDILGGIGYIIGLVGLGMFFNYRRRIKEIS
jgi:nickel transport protein